MSTQNICIVAGIGIWLLIGFLFHLFVVRMLKKAGFPIGNASKITRFFAAVFDSLAGLIGPLAFFVSFCRRLWKDRQRTKMWLFGYWPLVAHSINLVGHWAHARDEFKANVSPATFFMVDSHFAELAQCLKGKYKMDLGPNWGVEYLDGIPGVSIEEEQSNGD